MSFSENKKEIISFLKINFFLIIYEGIIDTYFKK